MKAVVFILRGLLFLFALFGAFYAVTLVIATFAPNCNG